MQAESKLEGLDVTVEYTYVPAELDTGCNEEFDVIGVWVNGVDIIEAINPSYVDMFEKQLQDREIGDE